MTDQVNRTQGQAPQSGTNPFAQVAQGQQGQQQGQEPAQGQQQQGQEPNTQTPPEFDVTQIQDPAMRGWAEAMQREAREARQEAARYRTERNAGRQQIDQFRQQHETDQERQAREGRERQAEFDKLQQENRDLRVGGDARRAAADAQAFNPEMVYSHIKDRIELDSSGKATNIADLIKDLRKSDPYLFRRVEADAGAGRGQGQGNRPGRSMNDLIRSQAGRGPSAD